MWPGVDSAVGQQGIVLFAECVKILPSQVLHHLRGSEPGRGGLCLLPLLVEW